MIRKRVVVMGEPAEEVSTPRQRVFTIYVTLWTVLAAVSLAYLALAIYSPASLSALSVIGLRPTAEDNRSGAEREGGVIEAPGSATVVADVPKREELQALTERVEALEAAGVAMSERLLAVERQTPEPRKASAPPATRGAIVETSSIAREPAAKSSPAGASPTFGGNLAEIVDNALQPRVLNAPGNQTAAAAERPSDDQPARPKATTATKQAAAVAPAAAAPAARKATPKAAEPDGPPSGPVGIQLGSGADLDTLRLNWAFMSEQNDVLRNLDARFTKSDALGAKPFTLNAGPFATREEAARACAILKAKGQTCNVGSFAGQGL